RGRRPRPPTGRGRDDLTPRHGGGHPGGRLEAEVRPRRRTAVVGGDDPALEQFVEEAVHHDVVPGAGRGTAQVITSRTPARKRSSTGSAGGFGCPPPPGPGCPAAATTGSRSRAGDRPTAGRRGHAPTDHVRDQRARARRR